MENHGLKIMYVDGSTDGHRGIYLNALLCDAGDQSFAVLPEEKSISGNLRNTGTGLEHFKELQMKNSRT